MEIKAYPTYQTGDQEFSFCSIGGQGVIELRMRITLMDAETRFYNIGFGVWDAEWTRFEQGTNYDAFLLNLKDHL